MTIINSHNGWSPLEEVWLGDVYPMSWYDHLPPDIRSVFYRITEITQEDLAVIQRKLEEFGVVVQRPRYENIEDYLDSRNGQLIKPEICPRDNYVTIGNTLLTPLDIPACWRHVTDQYRSSGEHVLSTVSHHYVNGANVVRVGRDIIIDADIYDPQDININIPVLEDYRITWERNGGHMDGCFAILKPGLILANRYYNGYDQNFPGWQKIFLNEPTYSLHRDYPPQGIGFNGKFFIPDIEFDQAFNRHVIEHAQNWVGDYTETYFELNCLVLDESNVMMLGYNEAIEKTLAQHEVTVHWVPFRCRGFWDGGMHCITVDIRRRSAVEDYFPDRG